METMRFTSRTTHARSDKNARLSYWRAAGLEVKTVLRSLRWQKHPVLNDVKGRALEASRAKAEVSNSSMYKEKQRSISIFLHFTARSSFFSKPSACLPESPGSQLKIEVWKAKQNMRAIVAILTMIGYRDYL